MEDASGRRRNVARTMPGPEQEYRHLRPRHRVVRTIVVIATTRGDAIDGQLRDECRREFVRSIIQAPRIWQLLRGRL